MTPASPDSRTVDRALTVFYSVVVLIALAGQAGAAQYWLGWPLAYALPAVAAVELGGIALSAYADHRRRLGERALAAQALSATVAAGAVAVNWFGHGDQFQGAFFAGMSALGYLVWLLHSGARRRDQLRAAGTLPPVAPAYGLTQWLRHPGLTRHARTLALTNPALGLYGSLDAARTARRTQQRQAAIATALRRKLIAAVDATTADIATATYDLDEIAARLTAGADYDGLTALIAADLNPARLTAGTDTGLGTTALAVRTADTEPDRTPHTRQRPDSTPRAVTGGRSAAPRITAYRRRHPDASQPQVARALGITEKTVSRHWSTTVPVRTFGGSDVRTSDTPVNGTDVPSLVTS